MLSTLFICGTFDHQGGKPSKLGQIVAEQIPNVPFKEVINGGHVLDLIKIIDRIPEFERIFWFANVSNSNQIKSVELIKSINKKCQLITSKRSIERDYTVAEIASHALRLKSNLVLNVIQKDKRYFGRILDPLGNMYLDFTDNFELIGKTLNDYSVKLAYITRIGSQRYGDAKTVPNKVSFFKLIKKHGKTFTKMTDGLIETERFLGNASFRCNRGFPSFKDEDGLIYVSQRNVDKKTIDKSHFVAVEPGLPVFYYGENKPSVDTPIQIKLYNYYTNALYMIHSHVYVKDAPMTKSFIPCGGLEEFDHIVDVMPDPEAINFSVNLKGHGSISISNNIKYIQTLKFKNRDYPEFIGDTN